MLAGPVTRWGCAPGASDRFPDLRVVVLSVHDEPEVARQFLDAGAAAFVLKRTAATDLLPAVREVLGGGAYISPALRQR
jgi:DNA-binding NarL/FixJ family response regulator